MPTNDAVFLDFVAKAFYFLFSFFWNAKGRCLLGYDVFVEPPSPQYYEYDENEMEQGMAHCLIKVDFFHARI